MFLAMLVACSRRYSPALEALEAAPPALTVFLLDLADFLQSGKGMIIALVVQGVTLVPFIGNRGGRWQPKLYTVLAVLELLALVSIWLGLLRPLDQLQALLAGG